MDRRELLNDQEEAIRNALDGRQANTWTSLPGIIVSANLTAMTCVVQPAIKGIVTSEDGTQSQVDLPLLLDVPFTFPGMGNFIMTFPPTAGDEVLVIFSSRCIDAWWQQGGVQPPMELRMHDLSDGFAVPGPRSQPNVITGGINASKLEIRNKAGTVYFRMGTKFAIKNASTDLTEILTDLDSAISTFMSVLAGFSGGAVPVTQVMLQVPAATAVTALTAVQVKIGALLE